MDDLVTWLRAQLDVAEAEADAILSPPPGHYDKGRQADKLREFAIWMLADVEAKRRILEDYDNVVSAIRRVDDVDGNRLLYARRDARMSDIRWLAQPYAGQPGWREEWQFSAHA